MSIYHIVNEKYSINFDLKLDSFYNFIDSLKKSTKYYSDYCNLKNINIIEFDNEYIDNINILKSELLKYYILITNDDNDEKYIIVNNTIKAIYNSIIKLPLACRSFIDCDYITHEIIKGSLYINYLTRTKLSVLIKIYIFYCGSSHYNNGSITLDKKLLHSIGIGHDIIDDCAHDISTKKLNNYLDNLTYESIYDRELTKILINLPNICISNISSKKLLNNISNDKNLIDLNEDLDDKYIAVD